MCGGGGFLKDPPLLLTYDTMKGIQMSNLRAMSQRLLCTATSLAAGAALASGPSGTDAVSELTLSGSQILMLFGGATALGVTLWLVIRVLNR